MDAGLADGDAEDAQAAGGADFAGAAVLLDVAAEGEDVFVGAGEKRTAAGDQGQGGRQGQGGQQAGADADAGRDPEDGQQQGAGGGADREESIGGLEWKSAADQAGEDEPGRDFDPPVTIVTGPHFGSFE